MPTKPPRACRWCGGLIYGPGPCRCRPKPVERFPAYVVEFYHSPVWRETSRRQRDSVPTCEWPAGCRVRPDVTDHRISLLENFELRLVPENLWALCYSHHSKKQAAVKAGAWRDPVADALRARKCATHPDFEEDGSPASCSRCA